MIYEHVGSIYEEFCCLVCRTILISFCLKFHRALSISSKLISKELRYFAHLICKMPDLAYITLLCHLLQNLLAIYITAFNRRSLHKRIYLSVELSASNMRFKKRRARVNKTTYEKGRIVFVLCIAIRDFLKAGKWMT